MPTDRPSDTGLGIEAAGPYTYWAETGSILRLLRTSS
jgi:hypothetical protein